MNGNQQGRNSEDGWINGRYIDDSDGLEGKDWDN